MILTPGRFPTTALRMTLNSDTCINVADIDEDGIWTIRVLNFHEHVKDNVILKLPK